MDKPTTAILARTNRALMPLEGALSAAGVPFFYINKSGFFAQTEVKAVLSYLGCCLYTADYLLAGSIRAPFFPTKFLPKTKLLASLKEHHTEEESYWSLLVNKPSLLVEHKNLGSVSEFVQFVSSLRRYKDLPASEATKQVLSALKAVDYYSQEESSPDSDPVENLVTLVKIAGRFSSIKEFLDYARKVTAASKKKSGVALSTLHSAKGLEFDTVYLVQCSEGMLPHAKSTDLESERNCFFVGCSRAERKLVITYSGQPSGFLKKETK